MSLCQCATVPLCHCAHSKTLCQLCSQWPGLISCATCDPLCKNVPLCQFSDVECVICLSMCHCANVSICDVISISISLCHFDFNLQMSCVRTNITPMLEDCAHGPMCHCVYTSSVDCVNVPLCHCVHMCQYVSCATVPMCHCEQCIHCAMEHCATVPRKWFILEYYN